MSAAIRLSKSEMKRAMPESTLATPSASLQATGRTGRLSWPLTLLAWALGLLFIYSALTKIPAPASFALAVKHFKVIPLWAVNIPAVILPWCELTAGVALLTVRWRRAGALLVLVMLCMFVIAVAMAIARDLDISCGCFGEAGGRAGYSLLVFDLVLVVLAAFLASGKKNPLPPRTRPTKTLSPPRERADVNEVSAG